MALETCSPSSSHKTGFMDLPVEIRLEVYQHLLHIPAFDKFARHPTPEDFVHANLLLANRQINAEATSMLYSDNMFVAHPTLLASFPRLRAQYGPVKESAVIPRIRRFHVQVRLDVDLPYDRDTVTKSFSGVDDLEIDVVQSMYLGAKMEDCATDMGTYDTGKRSWPELLGIRGECAVATIQKENPMVHATIVDERMAVTFDYSTNRVRVMVDKNGFVSQVPHVG